MTEWRLQLKIKEVQILKKIELLAPAGDLDKLKMAIDYGADAIYLAGEAYGLRTASKNFTDEKMKEAVEYVHERNKKIYVTMNIVPHDLDLVGIEEYVQKLVKLKIDALIISDPGIFSVIKDIAPEMEVHLSTQASATNSLTIKFWKELGMKRIVLARELSLEEIRKIKDAVPDVDLEAFVHGAMCISYSGRCLLSNYMTGRDANRGDCAQACRWKYRLVEEKRPNEYYPIVEEDGGTFIFNSKDLCMIEYIPQLIESGIDSFKIEGRVKSQYYVATVIRSYRIATDAYYRGEYTAELAQRLLNEIKKVSYRDFTQGFFLKKPNEEDQLYENSSYIRDYDFVGIVLDYDKEKKMAKIEQRNRIFKGDEVEIFGPEDGFKICNISQMINEKGEEIEVANHAREVFFVPLEEEVNRGDLIRKKIS